MTLLSVAEAHARLMALFLPVGTEDVPLAGAAGRVLARDVVATRPQPPFAASAMDGYAIRAQDAEAGARLSVIGTSAAGAGFDHSGRRLVYGPGVRRGPTRRDPFDARETLPCAPSAPS